jgi:hypothetical protein
MPRYANASNEEAFELHQLLNLINLRTKPNKLTIYLRQNSSNINAFVNQPLWFTLIFFSVWILVHALAVLAFGAGFHTQLIISRVFLSLLAVWGAYFMLNNGEAFFNEYASPYTLAVLRVVFYGFVSIGFTAPLYLADIWQAPFPWAEIPASQRIAPPFMDWYAMHVPISPLLASVALKTIAISAFAAMLGFGTRFFSVIFLIGTFYLNGFPNFFGKINHNHYIIWFAAILCFAPCADVLSVDAWWRKRKTAGSEPPAKPVNYYNVPIKLVALLIGIIYFFPGFHKIWSSGLQWALSDNVRNQGYLKWFEIDKWPNGGSEHFYHFAFMIAGLFTLYFETTFIFLLFQKKARVFAVILGLIFHLATFWLMHINFIYLLLCYVIFIDWDNVFKYFRKITAPAFVAVSPSLSQSKWLLSVGFILIGANVVAGIFKINSWPFSCFPTFENMVGNETQVLECRLNGEGPNLLAKTEIQNKYQPQNCRQWEYLLFEERDKQDTAAFKKQAQFIVSRIIETYSKIQPKDTINFYVQPLSIIGGRWLRSGDDTLICVQPVNEVRP